MSGQKVLNVELSSIVKQIVTQVTKCLFEMSWTLEQINKRLDAIETCLLTMTELRGYLRKAEHTCFHLLPCFNFPKVYVYTEELKYIDSFLKYLFDQEKYYRTLKNEKK